MKRRKKNIPEKISVITNLCVVKNFQYHFDIFSRWFILSFLHRSERYIGAISEKADSWDQAG
jgi:hypothetical protein